MKNHAVAKVVSQINIQAQNVWGIKCQPCSARVVPYTNPISRIARSNLRACPQRWQCHEIQREKVRPAGGVVTGRHLACSKESVDTVGSGISAESEADVKRP